MRDLAYYAPNIPAIASTTRYNHAVAIGEAADSGLLITYPEEPPEAIADLYANTVVLDSQNPLMRAAEACRLVESNLDANGVFLTTFHYAPAYAGWRAARRWVVDVYDDPHQYLYDNPRTYHQVCARALPLLLNRADRAVHTVHPSTPHTYSSDRRFAVNGAPTDLIEPNPQRERAGPIRAIWNSSHAAGLDIVLEGLSSSSVSVKLDVFGVDVDESNFGSGLSVRSHGRVPHQAVLDILTTADIGFCVLPKRLDWNYAFPIRIGEYLAGGVIPIASDFPGIRHLLRDVGVRTSPTAAGVASAIETVKSGGSVASMKRRARKRATEISWTKEREWFVSQVLR